MRRVIYIFVIISIIWMILVIRGQSQHIEYLRGKVSEYIHENNELRA